MSEAAVDRSRAFALGDGRTAVPEPDVKAALRRLGVATPAAVAIEVGNVGSSDVTAFAGPLVVKAFGGGIVHKTDVGAVRLGVAPRELPDAMARMSAVLAGHGLAPAGFLVEEQCERAGGVELLAGVVRREPFGLVVALGLGGTLAEAFRQVAVRLFPLSAADARDLIAEIPARPRSRETAAGRRSITMRSSHSSWRSPVRTDSRPGWATSSTSWSATRCSPPVTPRWHSTPAWCCERCRATHGLRPSWARR